jgi:hypothetical protein
MIIADENYTDPFAEDVPEITETREEALETIETQQCPTCNLLGLDRQPVPQLELHCACSKPVAMDHGIPVGPEQVLAQYNSRPPVLKTRQERPVAPTPIANPGRPVSTTPVMIRPNPTQPVYVAPRPISKCSRCHAPAGPVPASPVHPAPTQPVYVGPRQINRCSKCHAPAGSVPAVHSAPRR